MKKSKIVRTICSVFIKALPFLVFALIITFLFVLSFKVCDEKWFSILVSIATGLLASIIVSAYFEIKSKIKQQKQELAVRKAMHQWIFDRLVYMALLLPYDDSESWSLPLNSAIHRTQKLLNDFDNSSEIEKNKFNNYLKHACDNEIGWIVDWDMRNKYDTIISLEDEEFVFNINRLYDYSNKFIELCDINSEKITKCYSDILTTFEWIIDNTYDEFSPLNLFKHLMLQVQIKDEKAIRTFSISENADKKVQERMIKLFNVYGFNLKMGEKENV